MHKTFRLLVCLLWAFHTALKEIAHRKIKITPSFIHPKAIQGVYDLLISDKYNLLY